MKEIGDFFRSLAMDVPDHEKKNILLDLDRNKNGKIDYLEFLINYQKGYFDKYFIEIK